jgi:hypothetical protein
MFFNYDIYIFFIFFKLYYFTIICFYKKIILFKKKNSTALVAEHRLDCVEIKTILNLVQVYEERSPVIK